MVQRWIHSCSLYKQVPFKGTLFQKQDTITKIKYSFPQACVQMAPGPFGGVFDLETKYYQGRFALPYLTPPHTSSYTSFVTKEKNYSFKKTGQGTEVAIKFSAATVDNEIKQDIL